MARYKPISGKKKTNRRLGPLEDRSYSIYKILCITTNECYIGLTSRHVLTRFRWHIRAAYKAADGLGVSLRKHKPTSFEISTVATCTGLKRARVLEQYYIQMFDSYTHGLNSTNGG